MKKGIASKLDSVYFDDELDQLKNMINILSEMTTDSGASKDLKEKLAKQKESPKKRD